MNIEEVQKKLAQAAAVAIMSGSEELDVFSEDIEEISKVLTEQRSRGESEPNLTEEQKQKVNEFMLAVKKIVEEV